MPVYMSVQNKWSLVGRLLLRIMQFGFQSCLTLDWRYTKYAGTALTCASLTDLMDRWREIVERTCNSCSFSRNTLSCLLRQD